MPKLIVTKNMLLDRGDSHQELTRGDEIDSKDIPAGSLDTMQRLGQLVEPEDYEPEPEPKDDEAEPEGSTVDPLQTPISELELAENFEEALVGAGLNTINDVLEFGKANDGLQKIDGIADAGEKKIQAAIEQRLGS